MIGLSRTIVLPDGLTKEQEEVLDEFLTMLISVTADGGRKRAAGLKPSWKVDSSHLAAIFSHLNKWYHNERRDPDSGAHPFVHLAWRALAIAWQDTHQTKMPSFSLEQDAVAKSLDAPTCGKLDCPDPNHWRGKPPRRLD